MHQRILILLLASASCLFGQGLTLKNPSFVASLAKPATGGAVPTYLINQNFEGTGYDNGETWTETLSSGTIDEDYTGTVLAGSQSLRMLTTGFTQKNDSPSFSGGQVRYAYFMLRPVAIPAGGFETYLFRWQTSASGRGSLTLNNAGTLTFSGNVSGSITTVGTMTAGTTYHVWVSIDTTASPETVTVGFSTTGTRPTSGNNYASGTVEITDGASIDTIGLANGGGGSGPTPEMIFDKVLVDDVQIGDNP